MSGRGRPLRFLGLVAVGWVGMRVAMLWPAGPVSAIRAIAPIGAARAHTVAAPLPQRAERALLAGIAPVAPRVTPPAAAPGHVFDARRAQALMLDLLHFGDAERADRGSVVAEATAPEPRPWRRSPGSRWSGSAWIVARGGSGTAAAPGGQLGGSQAGVLLSYLIDPTRRIAAFGRVTAPLRGPGREAAIGVTWQPTPLPARLLAEERLGLDDGSLATGLGVVGGTDGAIPLGFRLESYGQAGAVARARIEPYADGAVRATRTVGTRGRLRLALGVGAWGAAQRDAQRLDLGPAATLSVPVGRRELRVALDWRQRVAGMARPGSGLALTVGSDF